MRPDMGKQKSFIQSFTWVAVLLLFMGIVFLIISAAVQLSDIGSENMTVQVNGVYQEAADTSARNFKLAFLLSFGLIGLVEVAAAAIILGRQSKRRRLARQLKQNGVRIVAEVTEYAASNMTVNHRPLVRLRCAYTDSSKRTFIFKSDTLRMDPVPYLDDDKVTVYYDRNDMKKYFVDVDGSVGLGTRIIEL